MSTQETTRYSTGAIILHWLIAFAIIGQLFFGFNMPHGENVRTAADFELIQLHKSTGITILLLSLMRLGWRLTHRPPALPPTMASWERVAARVTHIGFYVLIIATPLAGWALVSASPLGVGTVLYDVIPWPHLPLLPDLENRAEVADFFEEAHELLGKAIIVLLVVHVGAALKHHFISRDDVLARMIPFVKPRR